MPKVAAGEETRAACERYRSVLCEAQRALAALVPPEELAGQHALTVRHVNLQRMIAELTLEAIQGEVLDRRAAKEAVRAWQRFGRRRARSSI